MMLYAGLGLIPLLHNLKLALKLYQACLDVIYEEATLALMGCMEIAKCRFCHRFLDGFLYFIVFPVSGEIFWPFNLH